MKGDEPRFPGLARHWSILRESWKEQNIADRLAAPRSDHEFLPAALEVIETPPSPARRLLMLLLCGLLFVAMAWSIFGRVDVVAVATGKTVPSGNVKIIQSVEIGSVRAIHVRNGQFVKAGDLLLELDPTLASAEEVQSGQTLLSRRREARRCWRTSMGGQEASFRPPVAQPMWCRLKTPLWLV